MLTQTLFEQAPLASAPFPPSPSKFLSTPMLSHRCANLRPHPLSFGIHPQNTRGWGIYLSAKNFVPSPTDPLSLLFSPSALRPLPPMLPLLPLTPLDSALTKNRGEGPPGLPNLSTNPSQNEKPARIAQHHSRAGASFRRRHEKGAIYESDRGRVRDI